MSCSDKESIGRLIYKTSLDLRNYAEKMLSPYDLTVEQFHLLKNTLVDQGLSQNALCQHVQKKPANITRILDRLEKKNWIERRPNPEDRRSSLVFLTNEGQKTINEVSNEFQSYSSWFLDGISKNEEELFRKVIGKIDENIKKLLNEIE